MKITTVRVNGQTFEVSAFDNYWLVDDGQKSADVYRYRTGLRCAFCGYPLHCDHTEAVRRVLGGHDDK